MKKSVLMIVCFAVFVCSIGWLKVNIDQWSIFSYYVFWLAIASISLVLLLMERKIYFTKYFFWLAILGIGECFLFGFYNNFSGVWLFLILSILPYILCILSKNQKREYEKQRLIKKSRAYLAISQGRQRNY